MDDLRVWLCLDGGGDILLRRHGRRNVVVRERVLQLEESTAQGAYIPLWPCMLPGQRTVTHYLSVANHSHGRVWWKASIMRTNMHQRCYISSSANETSRPKKCSLHAHADNPFLSDFFCEKSQSTPDRQSELSLTAKLNGLLDKMWRTALRICSEIAAHCHVPCLLMVVVLRGVVIWLNDTQQKIPLISGDWCSKWNEAMWRKK